MQQLDNGQIIYTPSDLMTFVECNHASFLDVKSLGKELARTEADAMSQLLQQKGLKHEASYLEQLKREGKVIAEIPQNLDLQNRTQQTLEAMRSGADAIYQAVFFAPPWRGDADFLLKCDTPSNLGAFSYEVLDTKLTRTAEPKHIMQLSVYSALLAELQGTHPNTMYLLLGDQTKHSFQVADFSYYCMTVKARFEDYIKNLPAHSAPEPCKYCNLCHWREICKAQWKRDGHLSLVANIRRSQMDKLRKHGIRTVADLANTAEDTKVPNLNADTFVRLRSQARLQHHKTTTGQNRYEIIAHAFGKGFSRLPHPQDGDVFFDIEGDPLYPRRLEYLLGVYYFKDGQEQFTPLWAHSHKEEKEAFRQFMSFLANHFAEHPHAHIYHYNHYETTALKRLAGRYALCEEQLDGLLQGQKFVDLYRVVREGILTSEPGYSLKNLEAFYMEARAGDVSTAADSIALYNQWREIGDDQYLEKIADYNKTDCISTQLLRDWLLTLKPDDVPWLNDVPEQTEEDEAQPADWEGEYQAYQAKLGVTGANPPKINQRLAHLLEFHNREVKPQWWSMLDRQNKYEDELIDDPECLGGLQQMGLFDIDPEKGMLIYTYQFPPQEYKLKVGTQPVDAASMKTIGTIVMINEDMCIIKIMCSVGAEPLPERFSLGPPKPISTQPLRRAIYSYADHLLKSPEAAHAATEVLQRKLPRIQNRRAGDVLITSDDVIGDSQKAIALLQNSYLFLQGPPGAGKTYTSSHIIVELLKHGQKVGVTSNSHRAIHNLLHTVEEVASERGVQFKGVKKARIGDDETFFEGKFIFSVPITQDMELKFDLFAGTAWAFAHPHFEGHLDYLFVDEAGQVSVANVVAMARSTQNIILVGDQMQLGQPIQGTHPGEAGLSVLEFLLGDEATIPPERGIFLAETYRMRPSICTFISDAFYDGRLKPHESTSKRWLELQDPALPNEGIVVIPAAHEGCAQKSAVEGRIIKEKYQSLLGKNFTDQDGTTRAITEADILVVSPYNVQVNYLSTILPENARVGTVDKFQGQEAPIVLISMVTSSAEDLPRNIEFLYSRNRLNVAISRAQCLAIVVVNPKLLEIPCNTVEQMRLVNTFCWLYEYAAVVS